MKSRDPHSPPPRIKGDAPTSSAPMLTINECRRLKGGLRQYLMLLEEETSRAHARVAANVNLRGEDELAFLRASTTVVISVAAGLMEVAAERSHSAFDTGGFHEAARESAELAWRRLSSRLDPPE